MNNLKRLSSIFALAIISALSATSSARAGTSTGTFQGVSQIEVTPYVNNEPGTSTFYSWVPSVMNFTMTYDEPNSFYNNSFAYNISSNIQTLSVSSVGVPPYFFLLSVTDGISGQSADLASGTLGSALYHGYNYVTSFDLSDPSGEFIGPNGNGNPSDVSMNADITYSVLNTQEIVESVFIEFQTITIPEPSSIVMATPAALLILAWPSLRARIGKAYTLTRGRARQNQS
jgi:hypothetical protein